MARRKARETTNEILVATTDVDGYSLSVFFKDKPATNPSDSDRLTISNSPLLNHERLTLDVSHDAVDVCVKPLTYIALPLLRVALELIDRKRSEILAALTT